MAPLSKADLLAAWSALNNTYGGDTERGWRGIQLLGQRGCIFYAGRHQPDNEEIVVIIFSRLSLQNMPPFPAGKGFRIEVTGLKEGLSNGLMIRRQQSGNRELFTTMVLDVINALIDSEISENSTQLALLRQRIKLWQKFMEREQRPLSQKEEIGLFGELTCLQQLLLSDMDHLTVVKAWVGPLHGLQDFKFGNSVLEVKSTTADNDFCVTIQSLEQLDYRRVENLVLCGYRFNENPSGQTLNQLVTQLQQILKGNSMAGSVFESALCHAGYFSSHREFYTRRLLLCAGYCWQIDDSFPCLTQDNVSPAVISAKYQLELQPLLSSSHELSYYLSVFTGLTDGTY
ncbi:PD-(D/E)XK motif protein [Chimaeribacter arupi]|uniref:PD-(D/E)XK motif protein n=1 Tax=Chimaeribacter arupi TaxID=2060066 RepID=UPI000C7D27DD|nr:PD-(D/E)XK motif protein [Chimaeribacter arupi]PLR50750.1 PD-(D/E)XK motif protein [Chimaeribacter arupi]